MCGHVAAFLFLTVYYPILAVYPGSVYPGSVYGYGYPGSVYVYEYPGSVYGLEVRSQLRLMDT